jgi:hypothetical protein
MRKNNHKINLQIPTEVKVLKDLWLNIYMDNNLTDTRERSNVRYRQAAMTAMRNHGNLSLAAVGRIFGKDHATVLNAMKRHKQDIQYDRLYKVVYNNIEKLVKDALDDYDLRNFNDIDIDPNEMNYHAVVRVYRKHIAKLEHELNHLRDDNAALRKRVKFHVEQFNIINERYQNVNKQLLIKTGMI